MISPVGALPRQRNLPRIGTSSMPLPERAQAFSQHNASCAMFVPAIGMLAVAAVVACTPVYHNEAHEVDARQPMVSYDFSTDEGLIEANSKARTYCGQYAATPSMQGTITGNSDGSQTVTFKCIKTAAATPYPPSSHQPMSPMSYSYRTDAELLQAIESADAYCARSGQIASSSIVNNPGGTRALTYKCIQR